MSQPPFELHPDQETTQRAQPAQTWQQPPSAPNVLSRGGPAAGPGAQAHDAPPAYQQAALTNPAAYPPGAPAVYQQAYPAPGPQPQAAPGPGQPAVQAAPAAAVQGVQGVQGTGRAGTAAEGAASGQTWPAGVMLARPTGGAVTTPSAPPRPPGTVHRSGGPAGQPQAQRLPGLHIGAHVVNAAALEQLSATSPGAGLMVGADRNRQPVSIRLFHRKPTSVVLVGGVWAARLLTFRALALGTQVFAVTGQASAWDGLGAHAVGDNNSVRHSPADPEWLPPATAHQPVLVVRDTPPGGPTVPLSAWQARITVVHRLDYQAVDVLKAADLVIFQRREPGEAQWAAHVLRLSALHTRLVQQLEPEMLALHADGEHSYVWLHQTASERYLLGAPQR